MRLFLTLWLVMFGGCGASIHAVEPVDLSFSVYLEINGHYIYPASHFAEDPNSKPFEIIINVKGLRDRNLHRILLDLCRDKLGISTIETIQVNIISLFVDDVMVTHVESCASSSVASPVGVENLCSFPSPHDLLTLNKEDLIKQIHGKSLRVSIQSSTDSIRTVGFRLRERELAGLKRSNL